MVTGKHDAAARGRVALIAGNGRIPVYVAGRLKQFGRNPFVIAVRGEADPELFGYEHDVIDTAEIGVLASILKRVRPAEVVMVGGIRARPDLRRLRPDWTTIKLAAYLLPRLRAGDDMILRGLIRTIENAGFPVRGVHELVPDLLAGPGHIAGPKPTRADREAIAVAVRGAQALGILDTGQASVAIGRRIVALEAAEGTDLMLKRVAELREIGRLGSGRNGVLVKLAKPGQELRADLPTIGEATVENAAKAGLRGIAVHAENALISDFEATCERARERGLFLIGIDPDSLPDGEGAQ
ncbi:LpxI family protein [Oricola thermophila]|uniref:UDP-2,3-diacylglucosamine diphosphatase LpxI n=1 Tax=Oricola thermophila TaxID=2742145 RepID=A0A6N1VG36_9HYPH|nr:UDP-2,3-diacylglucosamine diphosphatase LpxI [Oricola thermophila]QKV18109.1 UDP-2,3-diacylglucosamine diphosphatase LpxI [Oricola thermophila]